MASDFDEIEALAEDAFQASFGDDAVTYKPLTGDPHSVSAIIHRDVPEANPQATGRGTVSHIEIEIRNAAAPDGRPSIDTGGDLVTIPRREGGTPEDLKVSQIVWQTSAAWRLRLR